MDIRNPWTAFSVLSAHLWKIHALSTACATIVLHAKRSTIAAQAAPAMETECDDFVSPQQFVVLGAQLLQRAPSLSAVDDHRRFCAIFGASPRVRCLLWSLLCGLCPPQGKPVHMLWALMFLKVYAAEHVHAALAGVDEKTSGSGSGNL